MAEAEPEPVAEEATFIKPATKSVTKRKRKTAAEQSGVAEATTETVAEKEPETVVEETSFIAPATKKKDETEPEPVAEEGSFIKPAPKSVSKRKRKTAIEQPSGSGATTKTMTGKEPEILVEKPSVSGATTKTMAEKKPETLVEETSFIESATKTKVETESETGAEEKAWRELADTLVAAEHETVVQETSFINIRPKNIPEKERDEDSMQQPCGGGKMVRLNELSNDKVCSGCFKYLSALPVRMTVRGFPICARCHDSQEFKNVTSAISKANIFLTYFDFVCVNCFDGCIAGKLTSLEVFDHEKKCKVSQVECVFCSYKGNILQIINHTARHHRNNLSVDGVIQFILKEQTNMKTTLVVIDGITFVLKWQVSAEKVLLKFRLLISVPITRHYRIHFSRKGDARFPRLILNEYGVISMKCETCVDISKTQLTLRFGEDAVLMCKISFEEVPMERKAAEIEARGKRCQRDPEFETYVQSEANKGLSAGLDLCNSVAKYLKMFAHRLLKCHVCQQIATVECRFCPQLHGCCPKCWTGYCKVCAAVTPYRLIPMLDTLAVECDWADCIVETKFYDYLTHKATCPLRPYKCPLKNCQEVRVGVAALTNHWHCELPEVVVGDVYELNKQFVKSEFVYWIHHADIYVVTISLEDAFVEVLLEEVDVVPNGKLEKVSCWLMLGDKTYDIPLSMVGSSRKCEGQFVYSDRIANYKPENKPLVVVINLTPDVPYKRSLVSVPVQRKPRPFITI